MDEQNWVALALVEIGDVDTVGIEMIHAYVPDLPLLSRLVENSLQSAQGKVLIHTMTLLPNKLYSSAGAAVMVRRETVGRKGWQKIRCEGVVRQTWLTREYRIFTTTRAWR